MINLARRFCRKTTLTRHMQKCHQGEVIAEEVEFKWEDEASESDQDVETEDEMAEQPDQDVEVEFLPTAQEVKMALRPRSYNYRRDYWPLPCETAQAVQEAHHTAYPHTPTEVMQVQMGQSHLDQQALINHQTQMDHQIEMGRQAQADHQARIDHQAQVDQQARIDHQARIDQQAQMDQHFNQMEYIPVQPVHNDNYYQQPQLIQQLPQQAAISTYLNAMTLNEQPPGYGPAVFYFEDKQHLDFLLPSDRISNDHFYQ